MASSTATAAVCKRTDINEYIRQLIDKHLQPQTTHIMKILRYYIITVFVFFILPFCHISAQDNSLTSDSIIVEKMRSQGVTFSHDN